MKVYEYKNDKNKLLIIETSNVNSHGRKMYMIFGFFNREFKGELIAQNTFEQILYPKSRRVREETIVIKNINFNILSKENINHIKRYGKSFNPYILNSLSKITSYNSILIENKIILNSKGQYVNIQRFNYWGKFFNNDKKDLKIKTN